MKKTIIAVAAVFVLFSCKQNADFESYGSVFDYEQVSGLDQVVPELEAKETADVTLVAEIDKVCQVKGCWMTLRTSDGRSVRVTFKDYGFFVPKDAGGKKAIIDGVASLKVLDEETARHYAQDAGRPYDENADRNEISIVASGVLIEKGETTR